MSTTPTGGTWSQIQHGWADDRELASLDMTAKGLFVWSFTNSSCASLTGFTRVGSRALRQLLWPRSNGDRPVSEDQLADVLHQLGAKPFVLYDWDHELLWCRNRAGYAVKGPKQRTGAKRWVERMPPSPLVDDFAKHYPEIMA
jgi:hypothetical protein